MTPEPVQIAVYVVVAVIGAGVTVPLGAAEESDQEPPLKLQLVEFVLDQVSTVELPAVTGFGFAVRLTVGTGNAVTVYVTVTVAIRGIPGSARCGAEVPLNCMVAV